jgi:hypothetical protein
MGQGDRQECLSSMEQRERQQIFQKVTFDEIRDAINSPGTSNTRKD